MATEETEDPRRIVARNLRALMDHARDRGDLHLASAQSLEAHIGTMGGGVSDSSILNFLAGRRAVDIARLTLIARAFGLAPWELLRADFDPTRPPAQAEQETRAQLDALRALTREELDAFRDRVFAAMNKAQP